VNEHSPSSAASYFNVRCFVSGQALSNIGSFSQIVALSLLVLSLTDSGLALGAVMAVQAAPMILLAPWAGARLDRVPLRRVLAITAVAGAAQAAALVVLTVTDAINLAWIFVLALGLGCVQVFDRPAAQAFIAELVPRKAIPSAVSLASAAQSIGRLIGPAVAAVLFGWRGSASVFAVNAVSYAAVLISLRLLRTEELFPRELHAGRHTGMSVAVRFAWHAPALRAVLLANALVGLLTFNFPTFFASISSLTFEQPSLFGIAESINAIFSLAAGVILARTMRLPTPLMVGLASIALGCSLAWTAVAPTPAWFLASMPFFGFVVVWYATSSQALTQRLAPREMGGRIMSLYTLGIMGTTPIGAIIVGLVIDRASPRAAIGLGAAAAILAGVALLSGAFAFGARGAGEVLDDS
jgi:MFS family permease